MGTKRIGSMIELSELVLLIKPFAIEKEILMKIETAHFEEMEILESEIITFPNGIPGLEGYRRFVLIPADEQKQMPFFFLQSVEEKGLCFFLLDIYSVDQKYEFELNLKTIEILKMEEPEDVLIFTTITINESLEDATTNLKAPIILNYKQNLGMQVILDNKHYLIKHPLSELWNKDKTTVKR